MSAVVKPRMKVAAGSRRQSVAPVSAQAPAKTEMRYLRDTKSGIIASRPATLTNVKDDIRRSWVRAAALSMDLIQNSGRLSGAADQVIADTVGSGLELAPTPIKSVLQDKLGYNNEEIKDLIKLIKDRWKIWAWNPSECDHRGKLNVHQMVDAGLYADMAYGELTQVSTYFNRAQRRRYGVKTGGKILMISPQNLVQDTNKAEGLFQGVYHDIDGRAVQYRFRDNSDGIRKDTVYPAVDKFGRPVVHHIYDTRSPEGVRGISRIAPAFKDLILSENLDSATVQTAILQTQFAATLTSSLPSAEAFDAIEALGDETSKTLGTEFGAMISGAMRRSQESGISMGSDPQISHLAPGEDFKMHGAETPGPHYQSLSASLDRGVARALGITYESYSLNNAGATYSSSRVGISSIWPVVERRRERISGRQIQYIYEMFFEEQVAQGHIPLKGGLRAFMTFKDELCWTQWRGPAKPTADDNKSAQASGRRLENGTTTMQIECAELGHDDEEIFEQNKRTHEKYIAAGMASPFSPKNSRGEETLQDPIEGQDANLHLEEAAA